MEKELKISELASIWGASVPTTWNRVRKDGLSTFKKKDENNKEVNYVRIPDVYIEKYLNNVNNNVKNNDNNGYYEDMLNVNNVNNNVESSKTLQEQGFTNEDIKEIITTITTVNKDYNDRLTTLTDRLISAESKQLLLEDKANREGYYINEINKLEKENNRYNLYNKVLISIITILLIFITAFITYQVAKSNTVSNTVSDTVVEKSVQVAPKSEQVRDQVSVQVKQKPKSTPKRKK